MADKPERLQSGYRELSERAVLMIHTDTQQTTVCAAEPSAELDQNCLDRPEDPAPNNCPSSEAVWFLITTTKKLKPLLPK